LNPYLEVDRTRRRHRWRVEPLDSAWPLLAPLVLGALAAPLAQPVLLWFLHRPEPVFTEGLAGLCLRLCLLVGGASILVVHEQVVRGKDRRVLDPHPVDPAALTTMLGWRLLRSTSGVTLGCCLLLSPLLTAGHRQAFLLGCLTVIGGWLAGLVLGFLAQLGAAWAARSPAFAGVLDLIRGSTPPMQAALIWAPGLGIAAVGASCIGATAGLEHLLAGEHPSWGLLLALPFLTAAGGWWLVGPLARRSWYEATVVIAEVDAAWAQVEDPDEARRVYLEWALRFSPGALRPHLLRGLRQGWRSHRSWIIGAWGLGLLGAVAGWTTEPDALPRTLLVSGVAVACLAAVAIRMETSDPRWLGRALGLPLGRRLAARGLVVFAYLQGALLPGVLAVLIRRGSEALSLLGLLQALAACCALLAAAVSPARRRGWLAYAPLALAAWILFNRSVS